MTFQLARKPQLNNSQLTLLQSYILKNIPFVIIVDYQLSELLCYSCQELQQQKIRLEINGESLGYQTTNYITNPELQITSDLEQQQLDYQAAFDYVQQQLKFGNSYLSNLTTATQIKLNVTLEQLFNQVAAKYKIYHPQLQWLCFSPETFITIKDNVITTQPMKGTARVEDLTRLEETKQELLNSAKETKEHYTIVDLLRNDLSIHGTNTKVENFKKIIEVPYAQDKLLLQMVSDISAQLDANWPDKLGEILNSLLPVGSISGAPKAQTLEIIEHAEQLAKPNPTLKRGFYSGMIGYYQPAQANQAASFTSGVLIRFIKQLEQDYYYLSGGGITINSKPQDEWQELLNKIYLPLKAIPHYLWFETMSLVYQQQWQVLNVAYHQQRISRTLQQHHLDHLDLANQVAQLLEEIDGLDPSKNYRLRFDYANNRLTAWHYPVVYQAAPVKQLLLIKADLDYSYKASDRTALNNLKQQFCTSGQDILIIKDNKICDTSIGNVLLFNGTDWITPTSYLLAGTMRQQLLDQGIVKEQEISYQDLFNYQKIMVVNALNPFDPARALEISAASIKDLTQG